MATKTWICAPQVRDLPRDAKIEMICTCCAGRQVTSAGAMMEARLGAQFLDLLEWQARCDDCGGAMRYDYDGKPAPQLVPVMTPARPRPVERAPLPVKAVVKRRAFSPQYALPMPLPVGNGRRMQAAVGRAR